MRLILRVLLLIVLVLPVRINQAVAQEGRELRYGQRVQEMITGAAPRFVYYFSARRGDVVSVSLEPLSGNLDALLLVVDNDGAVLATSDDANANLGAAVATLEIPEDNFFFIIATRFGHALGTTEGRFELALDRVGVVSEAGVFLNYGDSVVGAIDSATPEARYIFEAARGDIVNVHMQRISGNLDSYVYLVDESGQVLVANDDREGSLDAEINDFLILEPGFYTIIASRFGQDAGSSEGSFVLSLDTAPTSGLGLTPDSALMLRYGDSLAGTLDDDHFARYYTFGASRGDVITISMTRSSASLDPLLVLLDPRRQPLVEDDDSGPSNNALIQSYIIPETGTYFILATRFNGEGGETVGDYVIALDGISGEAPVVAPGTLTILYDSTVRGRIDDQTTATTYAFLARAEDVITITLSQVSGDLDPLLLLFTADGVQLAADDDSGPGQDARIPAFTIPADGTYYLIATRFEFQDGDTSGEYDLSLQRQVSVTPTP